MASIVRLKMNTDALDFWILMDYNWHGAKAMAYTLAEVNIGMLVSCLPGISPLLSRLFPRWFGVLDVEKIDPSPAASERRKDIELGIGVEVSVREGSKDSIFERDEE
jgi:hypothetical protein